MKRQFAALVAITALVSALLVTPVATAAATNAAAPGLSTPITGTAKNAKGQTVDFAGTMKITKFVTKRGHLAAKGIVKGTLTNDATGKVRHVSKQVILPIQATGGAADARQLQAVCDILHLTLGPLDLNLLGLVVHLDQVVLDITAETGPGNLLGNLLCALTGLLDPDTGAATGLIAQLLNVILGVLNL